MGWDFLLVLLLAVGSALWWVGGPFEHLPGYRAWLEHLPWIFGLWVGLFVWSALRAVIAWRRVPQAARLRLIHALDSQRPSLLARAWRRLRQRWQRWMEAPFSRRLLGPWQEARIPGVGYAAALALSLSIGGMLVTWRPVLGGTSLLVVLGGGRWWVGVRARQQKQRFHEQLPDFLDRVADALQAGFSLLQALNFIAPNLAEPIRSEVYAIIRRMELAIPLAQAFQPTYQRYPSTEMHMLIQGLNLHHRIGGNMVELLRQMSTLVRERVVLENEIRTWTAQSRLSAWVMVLLMPVSLILLHFFPTYHQILWNTMAGNLVVVFAIFLQIMGALLIRRLLRVEY